MSDTSPARRFYQVAGVTQVGEDFGITLDGKVVRTPGGLDLLLPTRVAAEVLAGEWDAQETYIRPSSMPFMQLACTAIDRVSSGREAIIDLVVSYGSTDLFCYLSESPHELIHRQRAAWEPLLDWAREAYGIDLQTTSGIAPIEQSEQTMLKIRQVVSQHANLELTVLAELTQIMGSVIGALAVVHGRLTPEAAFDVSQVDESWQIERWGEDADALTRREKLRFDIGAAVRFLSMIRS